MRKLEGKVAIVTGASKGIGASIARHLAEAGAAVKEIADQGGRAVAVQADLARPADIQRLFVEARTAFGRLDIREQCRNL